MRKTLSIFVAAAALSFLAACGASGGSDDASEKTTTTAAASEETTTTAAEEETTTTEAEDDGEFVEVAEWADSFCGTFDTWLSEIEDASNNVGSDITPGDVEGAKTAIAGLFGDASAATQTLISDLEAAGAPDIEDGDQLVADLIEKFEAFDAAAQDAQADSEALNTDDLAAFQADAEELTTRFQDEVNTVADSFGEIDTKYPSQELNDELTSACNF